MPDDGTRDPASARRLAIGVVVVALAIAAGYVLLGDRGAVNSAPSRDEIVRALEEGEFAPTYAVIRERAPEDYNALVARMVEKTRTLSDAAEGFRIGAAIIVDYRTQLAAHAGATPDGAIRTYLDRFNSFLRALEANGSGLCARVIVEGPSALSMDTVVAHQKSLGALSTATMNALFDGRDAGTDTLPPPTEEDWADVVRAMLDGGASEEEVQLVAAEASTDPRYCGAFIAFLQALTTADTDGAARARSEFFRLSMRAE